MCVHDPDEGGLLWEDGSNDPIPLWLDIDVFKDVYLKWISKDNKCHYNVINTNSTIKK